MRSGSVFSCIFRLVLTVLVIAGGFFSVVATTPGLDEETLPPAAERQADKRKQGANFTPGNDIVLATQTVDDVGGTITIAGTGTHLDGAVIFFPAGALPGSTEITIGYNDGTMELPGGAGTYTPPTLMIHTDGVTEFSQLVEITLPYTDENDLPVPFYIDENGQLLPVLVTEIDQVNKTFTFVTSHASFWTWLIDLFTDSPDEDTNFRPADDGFQIENHRSTINGSGECFGMTAFAQWYFDKKMAANGEFYGKYMGSVGTDHAGNSLTGQDVIATRAHSAINQSWTFSRYIYPVMKTTDKHRFKGIVRALKVTKRPVVVVITHVDGAGSHSLHHAVLCYGVDENDGQLFIYDPNKPGERNEIVYDPDAEIFNDYTQGGYTWNWFALIGTGTYNLDESFDNIFEDAQHGFTSDNMPHISVTSHQNGETVYTRNITLEGSIESSEVLVRNLDVYIGSEKYSTTVNENGDFSVGLSLVVGEQTLRFVTKDDSGNPVTPNNTDAHPFTIILNVDTSVMLVTLTWDKDDTDLDLYVIDPTGDYSAYYHETTADGGELDFDDTDGYGPEHWTLSSSDVIRWNQAAYTVRVHYFSDGGNGGTNYKLTVKLYEGTAREVEYTQTGYLSANDSDNDGPAHTGADWADFSTAFTLTSNTRGSASVPPQPGLFISAEVPDASVRRALKDQ